MRSMQVRDGRRRHVRWEDEELARPQGPRHGAESGGYACEQSRCATRSVADRAMHGARGMEMGSATATLNLYLSDALRKRNTHAEGDIDEIMGAAIREQRPESPLSRFLRKRHTNAPIAPPIATRTPPRVDAIETKLSKSPGYLERLLREKIEEAKCIQGVRTTRRVLVNSSSALVRDEKSIRCDDDEGHVEFPTAPVPHEKPKPPLLDLVAVPRAATLSLDRVPSMNIHQERQQQDAVKVALTATKAACTVQRTWRLYRRKAIQTQVTLRASSMLTEGEDNSHANQERQTQHLSVEGLGGDCHKADSQDQKGSDEPEPDGTETKDIPVHERSSEIPMTLGTWLDDEWSFLEEGRGSITELLDSSAHDEDKSIESLVWKKPHVVVEMKEAMERKREQRHRNMRRKFVEDHAKRHCDATEGKDHEDASATATSTPKRQAAVSIALPRSSSRLLPRHSKRVRRIRRDTSSIPRIKIQQRHSEQDAHAIASRVNAGPDMHLREPTGTDTKDIEAELLRQLQRYVVFSDPPATASNHSIDDVKQRNDLICVDGLRDVSSPIEAASVDHRDDDAPESSRAGAPISDNLNDDDSTPTASAVKAPPQAALKQSDSASDVSAITSEIPMLEASPSSQSLSSDGYEWGPPSRTPPLLSPLRHVEIEVKRTLRRIQTQYTLDQQKLIDAYADDAYFSTFFGSSPSPRRLSSVSPVTFPAASEATSTPKPGNSKQRGFLSALADFKQSLCVSRASSRTHGSANSAILATAPLAKAEAEEEEEEDDLDVDAELQAMLLEIRRCKAQIAQARAA